MPIYKKEKPVMREVIERATCDSCNVELTPVQYSPTAETMNFENALNISFSGGYGEYMDDHFESIICVNCVKDLLSNKVVRSLFHGKI